jgi:predicted alpha/beta hydrolase
MLKIEQIIFLSENTSVAGTLYIPSFHQENKIPGIILCQEFAGIKLMLLPSYAKKLAEKGFAALTFDYHGFGDSGANMVD